MISALSAGQRRVSALALLGLIITFLWTAVLKPTIGYFQSRADERLSDLRDLGRDRALLAQGPQIRAALAVLAQSPRWGRFYDGTKTDQAVLQMETDLRTVFKAPNNPTSMIPQAAITHGALTRIAIKVTLTMSIDYLAESLGRLQSNSKLLQIENLTIQAPDYQNADSNPALSIQAEIVGYTVKAAGTRI